PAATRHRAGNSRGGTGRSGNTPDSRESNRPRALPTWRASAGSGPIRGTSGRRCWTPGTPFFPPLQGGLDGLGSDAVHNVADAELRFAEHGRVGFGGQEFGEFGDLRGGGRQHRLAQAGGVGRFVRGEVGASGAA